MAINNVRHPIKDTVKADNSTYSSNKIESLIHSATELPETGIEDAGDVLMVNDEGEWDKGEIIIPQEVPTPTVENIGKVVTVVSDGDEGAEYGLETIPTPESPVFMYQSQGIMLKSNQTTGTLVCGTVKEKDLADAFDAGKFVRIIASPLGLDGAIEITIDNKKIVIHKEDVYVFDIISKSENGGDSKYWFEARLGYNHPQSGDSTRDLQGIVRMYFASNLSRTSVGTTFTVRIDADELKSGS